MFDGEVDTVQKDTKLEDLLAHGRTILTHHQALWAFGKYCEGYSQRILADCLYVHKNTIHNTFRRKGWKRPAGTGYRKYLPPLKYPGEGKW